MIAHLGHTSAKKAFTIRTTLFTKDSHYSMHPPPGPKVPLYAAAMLLIQHLPVISPCPGNPHQLNNLPPAHVFYHTIPYELGEIVRSFCASIFFNYFSEKNFLVNASRWKILIWYRQSVGGGDELSRLFVLGSLLIMLLFLHYYYITLNWQGFHNVAPMRRLFVNYRIPKIALCFFRTAHNEL